MDCDPLFVLARSPDGHLQVLQRLLTHSVATCLTHLEYSNEFRLKLNAIAKKSGWLRTIGEICEAREYGSSVSGDS
jgi:hypothetical protein